MIVLFIAASVGANLAMEQVSIGTSKIFWYLLLTAMYWIVAMLQVLQAYGYSATVFLLAVPATILVGHFLKRLIQLSLIYVGCLEPEDLYSHH